MQLRHRTPSSQTSADVVASVMTRAFALVTVKETDRRGRADQVAARARIHHLLVVDEAGGVVGTICRCRLADPGSPAGQFPIADFMNREVWTIAPSSSLGDAADAMDRLGVGILMVAEGTELLGVITKRDLGLVEEGHGP
jgi:CBS domain-containing protein